MKEIERDIWKSNFPIIRSVSRSVGRSVGWLICHNFLKGREVTLLCFYRSTCLFVCMHRLRKSSSMRTLSLWASQEGMAGNYLSLYLSIYLFIYKSIRRFMFKIVLKCIYVHWMLYIKLQRCLSTDDSKIKKHVWQWWTRNSLVTMYALKCTPVLCTRITRSVYTDYTFWVHRLPVLYTEIIFHLTNKNFLWH